MKLILLAPLAIFVIYYDVKYRRIPNVLVLATLLAGISVNTAWGGFHGTLSSVEGFGLAFFPMLLMHIFGALGAGDVKLFGAVGSVIGVGLVLPTFVVVVMLGALLAVYTMLRAGTVLTTLHGVMRIFVGLLPGWEMPRFTMAPDRKHTIPYGVAIVLGSLISVFVFNT